MYYIFNPADPPKNFSAKLSYNTGFGLLKIQANSTAVSNITYEHISTEHCQPDDRFKLATRPVATVEPVASDPVAKSSLTHLLLKILGISGAVGAFVLIGCYFRRRFRRERPASKSNERVSEKRGSQREAKYMDMVEEKMEEPHHTVENDEDKKNDPFGGIL